MELVSISDNSKYFLFCDTFLQTFSVWKHTDKSYEMVRNYLFTSTPKKKLGQVEQFKSYLTSKRNIINTKDYNTKSKPAVSKEKNYPEYEFPPQDLPEKSKKRYIKKFLRIVPLTSGVKMIPNKQTNSLANHQIGNLLTGNKTKFIAKDVHLDKKEEFFFHMTFQKP